jgi:hypothetical protein
LHGYVIVIGLIYQGKFMGHMEGWIFDDISWVVLSSGVLTDSTENSLITSDDDEKVLFENITSENDTTLHVQRRWLVMNAPLFHSLEDEVKEASLSEGLHGRYNIIGLRRWGGNDT